MNVTLTWAFAALQPGQSTIKGAKLYARVVGGSFTLINEVDLPTLTLVIDNVDPGAWEYQATTIDALGRESPPATVSITVPGTGPAPDSVPPSAPLSLTATVA